MNGLEFPGLVSNLDNVIYCHVSFVNRNTEVNVQSELLWHSFYSDALREHGRLHLFEVELESATGKQSALFKEEVSL